MSLSLIVIVMVSSSSEKRNSDARTSQHRPPARPRPLSMLLIGIPWSPFKKFSALLQHVQEPGTPESYLRPVKPANCQRLLLRLADLVEAHADDLVELEVLNNGMPI